MAELHETYPPTAHDAAMAQDHSNAHRRAAPAADGTGEQDLIRYSASLYHRPGLDDGLDQVRLDQGGESPDFLTAEAAARWGDQRLREPGVHAYQLWSRTEGTVWETYPDPGDDTYVYAADDPTSVHSHHTTQVATGTTTDAMQMVPSDRTTYWCAMYEYDEFGDPYWEHCTLECATAASALEAGARLLLGDAQFEYAVLGRTDWVDEGTFDDTYLDITVSRKGNSHER